MDKRDFVKALAHRAHLSPLQARQVLETMTDLIVEAVADGQRITLKGFGSFEARQRAARTGRIPGTETKIPIPEKVVPVFQAGGDFRKTVTERQKGVATA